LIVLPFTAPFSSCPLSSLLAGDAAARGSAFTASARDEAPPADDVSLQIEEKIKDEAVLHTSSDYCEAVVVPVEQHRPVPLGVPTAPFLSLVLRV